MVCCSCGCSHCGSGQELSSLVKIFVCSHPKCYFQSEHLEDVDNHKERRHFREINVSSKKNNERDESLPYDEAFSDLADVVFKNEASFDDEDPAGSMCEQISEEMIASPIQEEYISDENNEHNLKRCSVVLQPLNGTPTIINGNNDLFSK